MEKIMTDFQKLARLARHLEDVNPKKFDISRWVTDSIDPALVEENIDSNGCIALEGFCGTVACVLGHAAFIPEFREAGLLPCMLSKHVKTDSGVGVVVYGDLSGSRAGAEFFDIPVQDAKIIFGDSIASSHFYLKYLKVYPASKVNAAQAAEMLRRYVMSDGQLFIGKNARPNL